MEHSMTMQALTGSVLFHRGHLVVPTMMAYAIRKERKCELWSRKKRRQKEPEENGKKKIFIIEYRRK